jgi:hypothetical protein
LSELTSSYQPHTLSAWRKDRKFGKDLLFKNILPLLFVVLLIVGAGVAFALSRQKQDIRQQASGGESAYSCAGWPSAQLCGQESGGNCTWRDNACVPVEEHKGPGDGQTSHLSGCDDVCNDEDGCSCSMSCNTKFPKNKESCGGTKPEVLDCGQYSSAQLCGQGGQGKCTWSNNACVTAGVNAGNGGCNNLALAVCSNTSGCTWLDGKCQSGSGDYCGGIATSCQAGSCSQTDQVSGNGSGRCGIGNQMYCCKTNKPKEALPGEACGETGQPACSSCKFGSTVVAGLNKSVCKRDPQTCSGVERTACGGVGAGDCSPEKSRTCNNGKWGDCSPDDSCKKASCPAGYSEVNGYCVSPSCGCNGNPNGRYVVNKDNPSDVNCDDWSDGSSKVDKNTGLSSCGSQLGTCPAGFAQSGDYCFLPSCGCNGKSNGRYVYNKNDPKESYCEDWKSGSSQVNTGIGLNACDAPQASILLKPDDPCGGSGTSACAQCPGGESVNVPDKGTFCKGPKSIALLTPAVSTHTWCESNSYMKPGETSVGGICKPGCSIGYPDGSGREKSVAADCGAIGDCCVADHSGYAAVSSGACYHFTGQSNCQSAGCFWNVGSNGAGSCDTESKQTVALSGYLTDCNASCQNPNGCACSQYCKKADSGTGKDQSCGGNKVEGGFGAAPQQVADAVATPIAYGLYGAYNTIYGEEKTTAYLKAITGTDGYGVSSTTTIAGHEVNLDLFGNYVSSCRNGVDANCVGGSTAYGGTAVAIAGTVLAGPEILETGVNAAQTTAQVAGAYGSTVTAAFAEGGVAGVYTATGQFVASYGSAYILLPATGAVTAGTAYIASRPVIQDAADFLKGVGQTPIGSSQYTIGDVTSNISNFSGQALNAFSNASNAVKTGAPGFVGQANTTLDAISGATLTSGSGANIVNNGNVVGNVDFGGIDNVLGTVGDALGFAGAVRQSNGGGNGDIVGGVTGSGGKAGLGNLFWGTFLPDN